MKRNIFIVIEGLSGSGKTTLCNYISDKLGFKKFISPLTPFDQFNKKVRSEFSTESKFLYFLSHILETQKSIQKELSNNSVIMDKYYYTTTVFAQSRNPAITIPSFVNFLEPDFKFLLQCSSEIRRTRLQKREYLPVPTDQDREYKILELYRNFDLVHVDNNSNVENGYRQIYQNIKHLV